MSARREITKQSAAEYARATKKGKGQILDDLVGVTGWSRANARRALSTAGKRRTPVRKAKRKARPRTYGYDTLTALIRVWELAGMPSGKYLAVTMGLWLPKLGLRKASACPVWMGAGCCSGCSTSVGAPCRLRLSFHLDT